MCSSSAQWIYVIHILASPLVTKREQRLLSVRENALMYLRLNPTLNVQADVLQGIESYSSEM